MIKLYIALFFAQALSDTIVTIILVYLEMGYDSYALETALYIQATISNFLWVCLEALILTTFLKFSKRFEEQLVSDVTSTLKGSMVDSSSLLEQQERLQALRRHTAYQEITDAQIREVVLTMLTISVLSDTHSKAENISESSSGTENTTDMGDNSSVLF